MSKSRAYRPRRVMLTRAGASSVTASLPAIAAAAAIIPGGHTGPMPAVRVSDTSLIPAVIAQARTHQVSVARTRHHDAALLMARVSPGDSISGIARKACGQARDWTGIFAASRAAHLTGPDPDLIMPGQQLAVDCRYSPAELRYEARPAAAVTVAVSTTTTAAAPAIARSDQFDGNTQYQCGDGDGDGARDMPCSMLHRAVRSIARSARRAVVMSAPAGGSGNISPSSGPGGAFGACVVARESGGNSQVMNSSGHYGLYQFSSSTWAAYGGSPADFGHASVAEQERVFSAALAAGGQSNWSPYDGC